jgi:hypothetical protein
MTNKYLEKIAKIIPNFKQFGGVKGAIEATTQNPKDKARFAHKGIKDLRTGAAQEEKTKARKEVGKAVAIGATGAATIGAGAAIANKKNNK